MNKIEKQHLSIVIAGHVDSGKSTTTGRLIYDQGGIPERELEKLRNEAKQHGKESFEFAFFMDRQEEERRRGITIMCTVKEFYTETKHYTIIDAPGHKDFIKNMISGASQADVGLLLVPADGNFETSISKDNGQTRHHALLLNLLGVKQLIVGVNKMDSAKYSKDKFDEVANEMRNVLVKVGWPKKFVENVPFIPYSGYKSENLTKPTDKMSWYNGYDLSTRSGKKVHVNTIIDCLENFVEVPQRPTDKPMRVPINGVYNIKGAGDVLTGRCEQGVIKPGTEVVFLPTHTDSNPCAGKVFSIEMHHKKVDNAGPGDNVGMNIKGLDKNNMPRVGDIMIAKSDNTLKSCKRFTCQCQVLEHPGELKVGYTPIGCLKTSKAPLKMVQINWKSGKSTGNQKVENPPFLTKNETCEIVFEPVAPFVVETFKNCDPLSRVAILEGNSCVMLGKVIGVEY
jgi:elongation factor 1-alpha